MHKTDDAEVKYNVFRKRPTKFTYNQFEFDKFWLPSEKRFYFSGKQNHTFIWGFWGYEG